MSKIEKVLLTGQTHTMLHKGASRAGHGNVDLKLSSPGNARLNQSFVDIVPHPTAEQFFAGAWSACYISAVVLAAQEKKVALPADLAVDIEVDLGQTGEDYFLQARFNVSLPGLAQDVAEAIAHRGHEICPYSKATRGNIDVALNVSVS
jgi:Ohr subfamily peroxiredoxin